MSFTKEDTFSETNKIGRIQDYTSHENMSFFGIGLGCKIKYFIFIIGITVGAALGF